MKLFLYAMLAILYFSCQSVQAQIVNIEDRRIKGTNDSTYWYGSVRLSSNIAKVRDEVIQINATGNVQYKKDKTLTLLLLDGNFLRAGNEDFQESAFAHLRFNYSVRPNITTELFLQAQFNKLLLIDLRTLGGAGLRFQLFKSNNGQQRIYAGLAYLYEKNEFSEGIADRNWHRLSSYVSFTFRPSEGVKLVSTTYFQPTLSDLENYRLSTEWRLDTPIGKRLAFFSTFSYSRDRALPEGAPVNVYNWLNGFAFKF